MHVAQSVCFRFMRTACYYHSRNGGGAVDDDYDDGVSGPSTYTVAMSVSRRLRVDKRTRIIITLIIHPIDRLSLSLSPSATACFARGGKSRRTRRLLSPKTSVAPCHDRLYYCTAIVVVAVVGRRRFSRGEVGAGAPALDGR